MYNRYSTLVATAGNLLGWLLAAVCLAAALACLWLARYQPIEMDLAMLHYSAWLINEKGLLLYRDIFENNLPGPFFLHALIGNAFGYDAMPVRLLDAAVLCTFAAVAWVMLAPLSRAAAVLAPSFFTVVYFLGGPTATFQRDYLAALPVAVATAWLCRNTALKPVRDAALIGAACGLACSLKPNFIVVLPALLAILWQRLPGAMSVTLWPTLIAAGATFTAVFAVPFLWALRHADLGELATLYQTYTPLYISTRSDLYQYESRWQQWQALLDMQASHLGRMALFSLPGLLWAWRQLRDTPPARQLLCHLALITLAISWHEMIAGKYWYAHLLAPYFFAALCLSLLCIPARAGHAQPVLATLRLIALGLTSWLAVLIGQHDIQYLQQAGYNADNSTIRSMKIARYLQANLHPGDTVQGIDGSGDGQGSLLLAGALTATRFVEDIPLYLQPDSPVTQQFRREFLAALARTQPAHIVYIHNFFHPAGGNRLKEFSELQTFIQQHYGVGEEEDGAYTIYTRRDRLAAEHGSAH